MPLKFFTMAQMALFSHGIILEVPLIMISTHSGSIQPDLCNGIPMESPFALLITIKLVLDYAVMDQKAQTSMKKESYKSLNSHISYEEE